MQNKAFHHSISIQPVEKITYGDNSTKRYRNIVRHELELKWIKLLQTPHPLGFNDNIYHDTGGNVVRGNRTVMQMKSLRDYPDMSYGSNKQWNQLCE